MRDLERDHALTVVDCAACTLSARQRRAALRRAPLADAAEKMDRASDPRAAEAARRRERAAGRRHDGAALGGLPRRSARLRELLVRAGANVKAANRYGVTPLSLACTNGNGAMVELLLKAGADPNAPLPGGETPLMTAARTGTLAAVKALLARGAERRRQGRAPRADGADVGGGRRPRRRSCRR